MSKIKSSISEKEFLDFFGSKEEYEDFLKRFRDGLYEKLSGLMRHIEREKNIDLKEYNNIKDIRFR